VDWAIVYAASAIPFAVMGVERGRMLNGILFYFVLPFVYYGWFYAEKGATPGKLLMGLKVSHSRTGAPLTYLRAWCREVPGKGLSLLILGIGYLIAATRPDKRALHDLLCDTEVLEK